jgi:hypothetical protein
MKSTKERLARYLDALPALLPDHLGKFALICDGQITVHETPDDAMEAVPDSCTDSRDFLIIRIEPAKAEFAA